MCEQFISYYGKFVNYLFIYYFHANNKYAGAFSLSLLLSLSSLSVSLSLPSVFSSSCSMFSVPLTEVIKLQKYIKIVQKINLRTRGLNRERCTSNVVFLVKGTCGEIGIWRSNLVFELQQFEI